MLGTPNFCTQSSNEPDLASESSPPCRMAGSERNKAKEAKDREETKRQRLFIKSRQGRSWFNPRENLILSVYLERMVSFRALSIVTLVFRLLTLALLGASIFVLATDKIAFSDGYKVRFKDVIAYRFVMATAAVGFLYTLFQIPFAMYYVFTEKRLIRNKCLPQFDFYADKIVAFLLATGVGAGFAVTFELKKVTRDFVDGQIGFEDFQKDIGKFFDRANIAVSLLFLGFLCSAVQSFISSMSEVRMKSTTNKGFFG